MPSKTGGQRVFETFRATALSYGMILPGDSVLAACSGGPDSMALVSLLLRMREEMPLDLHVAHLNHKLRPTASADEEFVREMAGRWVLPLTAGSKSVRLSASRRKLNLEEAGRMARYEFLAGTARRIGATKIATGHNLNDQAETVLLRIMRGTGSTGLAGIAPIAGGRPCPIVRPLIGIGREAILGYLDAEGIPYREDESNCDRRFLRNRIRLDLIPELEKGYEPRIVEHLARLALLVREEESLLGDFVRGISAQFIVRKGREVFLDAGTLSAVDPGLARRIAREFIRELKGDLRGVSFHDVDSLLRLRDGKEKSLGTWALLRREKGLIGEKRAKSAQKPYRLLWDGIGTVEIPGIRLKFKGKMILKKDNPEGWRKLRDGLHGDDCARAALDLGKLELPLLLRNRRPGDIYRPLGALGRKKLKEILRAKGVPEGERALLPLILSGGEIVWAPGLPVAEKFKVTEETRAALLIEKLRSSGR